MIADEAHAVGWRLALAGLTRLSSPAAAWLVAVGVALLADNPDEAVDRLIADPLADPAVTALLAIGTHRKDTPHG